MTDHEIINFRSADPFTEVSGQNAVKIDSREVGDQRSFTIVHIRVQQRNGTKMLTTVEGVGEKFDKKRILRELRKKFACNGTIIENEQYGQIIQLQGDQRTSVSEFLTKTGICSTDQVMVHGF